MQTLIHKLYRTGTLTKEEWVHVIAGQNAKDEELLFALARKVRGRHYGQDIYLRGLIEFTNYCRNDCYYCGIRKSNDKIRRYRLTKEEILRCCQRGYQLGFRTFVLQGGEDEFFTKERMAEIIRRIRMTYPDCAITLSLGERSREDYQAFYEAGADRYLLRQETCNAIHYQSLHPVKQTARVRQKCLWVLKEIGYQVGAGFMVGSPEQTPEYLAEDMLFLKELEPQMVGIGPFLPQKDTPFGNRQAGSLKQTLWMLGLLRLMLPKVLLPATTALGSVATDGRERGIHAGANVIMPNLTPQEVRGSYRLYDKKLCTGTEAAECKSTLEKQMRSMGYQIVEARGDSLAIEENRG